MGKQSLQVLLFCSIFTRIDILYCHHRYEVIRVNLNTPRSYEVVKNIYLTQSFDFMVPPTKNGTTEIMVCPEQLRGFKLMLQGFNMPFETIVHNVQR